MNDDLMSYSPGGLTKAFMHGKLYVPAMGKLMGWYLSEKLDGHRCLWDGGVTQGVALRDVPFANIERKPELGDREATGLWGRGATPIFCPKWFTDGLPPVCLDGELYMGRGQLHATASIVRSYGGEGWEGVSYQVFEMPCECGYFKNKYVRMLELALPAHCSVITQTVSYDSITDIRNEALRIVGEGGEGLMMRDGYSMYTSGRSGSIVKIKPRKRDVGIVTGYKEGKGRNCNVVGSMRIDDMFDLNLAKDIDRRFPPEVGSKVTYEYRFKTDGVPVEASFIGRLADHLTE